MTTNIHLLKLQIRYLLIFFMAALVISGATAMPVQSELNWALTWLPAGALRTLFNKVVEAINFTNQNYPFLMYGYDWLAFAHFVIAVAFIGPYKNPVKNIWVIEFGIIACALIIPFALVMGGLRGLPFWWRLIDCSFGVLGFIPLWFCRIKILQLEKLLASEKMNIVF
jgi:hypothetical protein